MELYRFGPTSVQVWPHRQHLVTLFDDHTKVDACPEPTVDYHQRAKALGYTGQLAAWHMCRDHGLFHTMLSWMYFGTPSPALWAVAHGEPTTGRADIDHEESIVLRCQAQHRCYPFLEHREN